MRTFVLLLAFNCVSCGVISPLPYKDLNLWYGPYGETPISKLKIKRMSLGSPYPDYLIHCEYVSEVTNEYRESCLSEIRRFLVLANKEFLPEHPIIEIQMGDLKLGGQCFDTFIPGREGADCVENLYAPISIGRKDGR